MRVLVGCEYSGRVRDAFIALGHDAMSCDLLPTEVPGPHYQGDVRNILDDDWDLGIFHPSCQYLANSGVRWLYGGKGNVREPKRWQLMEEGADFFKQMLNAPIPRIAVENPVMHGYAKEIIGVEQSQTIQPWWFGDPFKKATCLWLKNLPLLIRTDVVPKELRVAEVHGESPGPNRWKNRSRTYPGFAKALATQWSEFVSKEDE